MRSRSIYFALGFLAVACTHIASAAEIPVSVAKDVVIFQTPLQLISNPFRVKGSSVEQMTGGEWKLTPDFIVPPSARDADNPGTFILGAPAVVLRSVQIDVSAIAADRRPIRGCFNGGALIFVHENRVPLHDEIITEFEIFAYKDKFDRLASFKLKENLYNMSLMEAWCLGGRYLFLSLSSSRHPYENALAIFDLTERIPAGYREYSKIQYLPNDDALWVVDPVPNSDNIAEALAALEQRAKAIPIFTNSHLNPLFGDPTELIKID